MWYWTIEGCPGQPDQSEIVRAIFTPGGRHIFHYTIKKEPLSNDEIAKWQEILKLIKIGYTM
jgi:hypothetical protein